jgi:hypothetical protein
MACCNSYTTTCCTYPTCNTCSPYSYYRNDRCQTPQCNNLCYNYCQPACPPSATPCPVLYDITGSSSTTIPSGTVGVAPPLIPPASTSIPIGSTLTPIIGFTATPTVNIGGISYNNTNGQFTMPITANYLISAYIGITANAIGTREVYIYKVDGNTGVISLVVSDSRNATATGVTYVTLTTNVYLNVGDLSIYFE